jgi:hypothetical protein
VEISLLEMNTLDVFLQVGSKTESFRFAAVHIASMSFAMHHRNMFAGMIVNMVRTFVVARNTHLYDFLLAKVL